MNATLMHEVSPNSKARTAGAFWLLTIVAGIVSMIVFTRIVVPGNATTTVANIRANESLFALGTAADLLGVLSYIVVTVFIYELLKPVQPSISRLAAFFSVVGCSIGGLGCVLQLAPTTILAGTKYLVVFAGPQIEALVFLFVRLRAQVNNVALVFFGLHCLLIGCLILRSRFLPRIVGILMVIAGLGWLTFLWPPLSSALFPYNMAPGIIGEATLTLWLLVMGVNVERWKELRS